MKPNVLFIIMDDQRADTLGLINNPLIQTPNLDRIAKGGTVFTQTFVTVPICAPGRAEVLTGCNSFTNHVLWFGIPINPELTLMPEAFREAGYHTGFVGKWHNDGHPRDKGFERTRRCFGKDLVAPQEGHIFTFEENAKRVRGHSTELFTDALLEELAEAPADKPWFMYVGYHSPHDPFECPEPYQSMYDTPDFPLPDNFMPEHPFDNGDMTIRDELLMPFPRSQEAVRQYRARYYGMITHHDHHIGRILDRLEEQGVLENTIVVFTGDHGLAVGSHGLLGKENMYDHSTRIPLMMMGPGIAKGQTVPALSCNTDIFPTLCTLAGIPVPETVRDGKPLISAEDGGAVTKGRDSVFSAFRSTLHPGLYAFLGSDPLDGEHVIRQGGKRLHDTQRMVRTETHKLCYYPLISKFQLFDLQEDPQELHDLLQVWRMIGREKPWPFQPMNAAETVLSVAEELREKMLRHMEANGDPVRKTLQKVNIKDAVVAAYGTASQCAVSPVQ